ncbi:MAG: glycosyltransferase family 1 protein, partial [Chitinophagaceae bacterium]|nr:glycosyltransferase family 1 protein [Chitinophagaceae bacterium]
NKNYYENLGVDKSKMAFTPYAVDNARFTEAANSLKPQATSLRVQIGFAG